MKVPQGQTTKSQNPSKPHHIWNAYLVRK